MNLTNEQNKVLILTMELDLKAKEYKMLCDKFDDIKTNGNVTDDALLNLKEQFLKNQEEIKEINEKLKKLKSE